MGTVDNGQYYGFAYGLQKDDKNKRQYFYALHQLSRKYIYCYNSYINIGQSMVFTNTDDNDHFQIMLMGGTILGPGTIFLMLVGAFVAVFHIDNWTSFYYNIMPIIIFVFVCFTCKPNIQVIQ